MRLIVFCGREEAEEYCQAHFVPSVLSISDPTSTLPRVSGVISELRLRFWDVSRPNLVYPGAKPHDVSDIIDFFHEAPRPILVHCEAGISRSSAATLIGYYLVHKNEKKAWEETLKSRLHQPDPLVVPNRLMLRYADKMLGSDLFRFATTF
jgi:predicted protein tyrosine phosphatase